MNIQKKTATHILSAVCKKYPHTADHCIDLLHGIEQQACPCRCVEAYFSLVAATNHRGNKEISLLTTILRDLIHIEARNQEEQLLETISFQPKPEENLENYSQRIIQMMQFDRAYGTERIKLRFCYQ